MTEPVIYTPQPLAPTDLQPAPAHLPVVLPTGPLTVAYRPGADGRMIAEYVPVQALAATAYPAHPMVAEHVQAPEVVRVRTGIDPVAQRLAGLGAAAAGAGFGISEVVNALAGAGSALALLAVAAVAWKVAPSGSRTVVNQQVTNHHTTSARGMFARAGSRVDHNRYGGGR